MLTALSHAELKSWLDYNPATGIFTWLKLANTNKAMIGDKAGSITLQGYIKIGIKGVQYKAHRLAWLYMIGEWPATQIDHVNRIKGDNRWENLRPVYDALNKLNTDLRRDNTSGYKGVFTCRDRWHAAIYFKGKKIHVGAFSTREEAAFARAEAYKKLYGTFLVCP